VGIGFYDDPRYQDRADTKAIAECIRVLKRGGIFVVSVPCGVPSTNSQQRIYGVDEFDRLLSRLTVEDKRYYKKVVAPGDVNNTWVQVPAAEASVVSSGERTECICLVKARKS
jgi:hypothetical protein